MNGLLAKANQERDEKDKKIKELEAAHRDMEEDMDKMKA